MSFRASAVSKSRPYGLQSAGEVCAQAGCARRTLDHWVRIGLIVPAIDADGTGTDRWFTTDEIVATRLAVILAELPIYVRRLILKCFRADPEVPRLLFPLAPNTTLSLDLSAIRRTL